MITGNIKDAKRYYSVNENFKKAFEYLSKLTKDTKDEDFEGDGFKCLMSTVETSDTTPEGDDKPFEIHKKWLDIHYVIEGSEGMGYSNAEYLKATTEYNEEDDYQLMCGDVNKIVLKKGDFCIVFPEDAHLPLMKGDTKEVKKAVVKIKL